MTRSQATLSLVPSISGPLGPDAHPGPFFWHQSDCAMLPTARGTANSSAACPLEPIGRQYRARKFYLLSFYFRFEKLNPLKRTYLRSWDNLRDSSRWSCLAARIEAAVPSKTRAAGRTAGFSPLRIRLGGGY